ncbi:MAG: hypothetical protein AB1671_13425, partial [Thermodesulfobacteriota bacterium]
MHRKGSGFWLLWGVALLGAAGCTASPAKNTGILYGALAGAAVGSGVGVVVGNNCCTRDSDSKAHGGVIGAGAGALI